MEEALYQVIQWHGRKYPKMEPADYVKLLYQNEFGCAHLLHSSEDCLKQMQSESAFLEGRVENSGRVPYAEPIGNGLCRIFLEPGEKGEDFLPLLNLMCLATARTHCGNQIRFQRKLGLLKEMAGENALTVGEPELEAFLERYLSNDGGPVSHSAAYREQYAPHYRVVRSAYCAYFSVFQAVMKLLRTTSHCPVVVAIDGRCGSGKSFLAGLLAEVFECGVFHLDDFYLPMEQREADWRQRPAGNIDRNRFIEEVLIPLRQGRTVCYRPYSCQKGTLLPETKIQAGKLAVAEGSYSLHPDFESFYEYRVFLTCAPNVQQRRIFLRNGRSLHAFLETWIPMEEHYFETMKIPKRSDMLLDTTDFEDFKN